MDLKLLQIIASIVGVAETVVPVFIHNPKSQQIEGVIITTTNSLLNSIFASALTGSVPQLPTQVGNQTQAPSAENPTPVSNRFDAAVKAAAKEADCK